MKADIIIEEGEFLEKSGFLWVREKKSSWSYTYQAHHTNILPPVVDTWELSPNRLDKLLKVSAKRSTNNNVNLRKSKITMEQSWIRMQSLTAKKNKEDGEL